MTHKKSTVTNLLVNMIILETLKKAGVISFTG